MFQQCYNVIILESGSKEEKCANMLVEVDLSKPLIRGTKLSIEGENRWVIFRYEQLPLFCFYCGKTGHGERGYSIKVNKSKNSNLCEGQYGDWLRAVNGRTSNKGRSVARKEGALTVVTRVEGVDTVRQKRVGGKEGKHQTQSVQSNDLVANREVVSVNNLKEGTDQRGEGDKGEHQKLGEDVRLPGKKELVGELVSRGVVERETNLDIEMRDTGEGKRALIEIDQNNKAGKEEIAEGSIKIGTWKRKARANGKENRNSHDGGKENGESKDNLCEKKRFYLGDEGDGVEKLIQVEKKTRLNSEEMILSENVVEVASQKWAQCYQ